MALRLTKTSLPTPDVTADSDPILTRYRAENAAVQAFINRAAQILLAPDLAPYVRLFSEAATEFPNPQRQYQVRKLLIEQGLGALRSVDDRRAVEILLALAHGTVAALELDPAEPVLLNYAGVVLYELWATDAARALFQAAKRLDPELPHLEQNLAAVTQRSSSAVPKRLAFHPALAAVGKRAKRVAARARPAEGQRISLCMIVRDEEEMLPRTLEAIRPAVDEIIVVDTGSQDRTIEIAKSFGATVIEREWTGSFSDARNVSLEAATGDWFLYLDADEVLVPEDAEKLRELAGQTWREAFYLHETNFTGTEEVGLSVVHSALRLFRNRPEYRFVGRLHEQIAVHLPAYLPERVVQSAVRVNHYGYLGVVRESKDKARRNIDLLLQQQEEGATNSFFHYNLGSEYLALGDVDKALPEFEKAHALIDQAGTVAHEYVPSLTSRTVKALRTAGRYEESQRRADQGLERFPGFTDLVYEQGITAIAMNRIEDAIGYLRRAIEMGDAPSKYTAMIGAGTFLPRAALATIYVNRREPGQAVELLRWSLEHHPDHLGTIFPYATALLQSGEQPQTVVADIEQRVEKLNAAARFMLGTALFEQGHGAEAEAQFRTVLERQPHSGAARAALVEALLYQRRYADAVTEAQALPADSPAAVIVIRSELFARLLLRDAEGAPAALERAREVGLPRAERDLYSAWLAQQRGEAAVPPVEGLALLSLMLESLLRVQDFESFESLLPLLERLPIAQRERRELLAQMYLRRGFLRSAGREWMAVCELEPDARALAGLAQVALGNGQAETAHAFATHALSLDPSNEGMRRIAEATRQPAPA
jgi:tetratricopeptide (TPR) repeat protein